MTDREIAQRAIAILRRDGWCQGKFVSESGLCCVVGAVAKAAGLEVSTVGYRARGEIASLKHRLECRLSSYALTTWNDAPGRTVDEVIALLESVT